MAEVQVTAGSLTENDSHPRNSQPLVSVIIPVYNAEKYVEQAVRSIMNQTYKNLEILITDDCSTDGSFAILQKLAEEDARIKLFQNEQNQKIVRTLNALVERATGKYIARMDADDISLAKRIEKQVAFLEANADIAICGTNAWHIDEKGKRTKKTCLPLTAEDNQFFLQFYSTFYHPTVMFRSQVYKQNLYSQDFLYAEDYELWCRLVFEKGVKGANLGEALFEYRIFNNQSSEKHRSDQIASSVKIFDTYKMVDSLFVVFHKNIFFEHNIALANEMDYIKKIYKRLSKRRFCYSYEALKKLMFHLFKVYGKRKAILFCMHWYGLLTCVGIFIESMGA